MIALACSRSLSLALSQGFHHVGRHVYLDNPYFLTHDEWLQPAIAKRKYRQHNAAVRQYVPRGRLLEYKVSEGWEPLCTFLKLPVPSKAFPNLNDTRTLRRAAAVIWTLNLLLPVLAIALLYYCCLRAEAGAVGATKAFYSKKAKRA